MVVKDLRQDGEGQLCIFRLDVYKILTSFLPANFKAKLQKDLFKFF